MLHDTDHDRIRDLLAGRLPAEEAQALRRRIADDPTLAEEAAQYEAAWSATAGLEGPVDVDGPVGLDGLGAVSALTFEQLPLASTRAVPTRWLLAAAALVLLGLGTLLLFSRGPDRPTPVRLAAIPMEEPALQAADTHLLDASLVPATLAAYRPTDGETIRWLDDPAAAQTLARLSGREVLHYRAHPTCPYCLKMEEGTLAAAAVLDRVTDFVPFREYVTNMSIEEFQRLFEGGWPRFQAETADGVILAEFHGMRDAAAFAEQLDGSRRAGENGTRPVPWEDLTAWLEIVERTRQALVDGRAGAAWTALEEARPLSSTPGLAAHVGGLERLVTHAAWAALDDARHAADGKRALAAAAARFEGSPFAADFRALEEASR